ncbi:hypothetical protein [Rhizobium sp. L1K21]|nr:hypothetical protein [Rhizobium sp. L1K21]MCO6188249.1 hypothetical protein [Rhizobium sp. L1K21]
MGEPAIYVIFSAVITIPMIGWFPHLLDALFALFRLSSSMIGTPWP